MNTTRQIKFLLSFTLFSFIYPIGVQVNEVLFSTVELCMFFSILLASYRIQINSSVLSFFKSKTFKFYSAFFLGILASSLLNGTFNSSESVISFIRHLEAYIFFCCISLNLEKSSIGPEIVVKYLKRAAILGSIYTILTYLLLNDLNETQKIGGLLGGGYGLITSTGILIFGNELLKKYNHSKALWFTVCLIGTLLTLSRTWLFAPMLSFLILYLITNKVKILALFKITLGLVLVAITLYTLQTNSIGAKITGIDRIYEISESIIGQQSKHSTIDSRLLKWYRAYQNFLSSPFSGVGLNKIDLGLPSWIDRLGNKRSDSQFMDTLASNGVIGFVPLLTLLLFMLKTSFKRIFNHAYYSNIYFLMIVSWIVASMFWATLEGFNIILFAIHIILFNYISNGPINFSKSNIQ